MGGYERRSRVWYDLVVVSRIGRRTRRHALRLQQSGSNINCGSNAGDLRQRLEERASLSAARVCVIQPNLRGAHRRAKARSRSCVPSQVGELIHSGIELGIQRVSEGVISSLVKISRGRLIVPNAAREARRRSRVPGGDGERARQMDAVLRARSVASSSRLEVDQLT